jgi:hypothetical protein
MKIIENDVLHKEIDLIQACISRMAHNSFLIKGWAITIVAVVLALADKTSSPALLCGIMLIPLISFWWLDTFFLRTERMYREMYTWVIKNRSEGNDEMLYDLNPKRFEDKVDSRCKIMRSKTLRCFYGIPILIVLGVLIFHLCSTLTYNQKSQKINIHSSGQMEFKDIQKQNNQ